MQQTWLQAWPLIWRYGEGGVFVDWGTIFIFGQTSVFGFGWIKNSRVKKLFSSACPGGVCILHLPPFP